MYRRGFNFGMISLFGGLIVGCRGPMVFQASGRKTVAKALEESRIVEFMEMDAVLTTGENFRGLVVVAADKERYPFVKGRGEQLFVSVDDVPITASIGDVRLRGGEFILLTPTPFDPRLVR